MALAINNQRVEDSAKEAEADIPVGIVDTYLGWWTWKEKYKSKMKNK